MTWTYTGNPATDTKDAVRLLIQDTDASDPQMSDEEILWVISETGGNRYRAASRCCRVLAARGIKDGVQSKSVGDLSVTYGNSTVDYAKLSSDYDRLASLSVAPYVGGVSQAAKLANRNNTDAVPEWVSIGFMDHPDASDVVVDDDKTDYGY